MGLAKWLVVAAGLAGALLAPPAVMAQADDGPSALLETIPLPPLPPLDFDNAEEPRWLDTTGEHFRIEDYTGTMPPAVEGLELGDEPTRAWFDYYNLQNEQAREDGDYAAQIAAYETMLFLARHPESAVSSFGENRGYYRSLLEVYPLALFPVSERNRVFRAFSTDPYTRNAQTNDEVFSEIMGSMPLEALEMQAFVIREVWSERLRQEEEAMSLATDGTRLLPYVQILRLNHAARGEDEEAARLLAINEAFLLRFDLHNYNYNVEQRASSLAIDPDFASPTEIFRRAAGSSQQLVLLANKLARDGQVFEPSDPSQVIGEVLRGRGSFDIYAPSDPALVDIILVATADMYGGSLVEQGDRMFALAEAACAATDCPGLANLPIAHELDGQLQQLASAESYGMFAQHVGTTDQVLVDQVRIAAISELTTLDGLAYGCFLESPGGTISAQNTELMSEVAWDRNIMDQLDLECFYALGEAAEDTMEEAGMTLADAPNIDFLLQYAALASFELGDFELAARQYDRLHEWYKSQDLSLFLTAARGAYAHLKTGDLDRADALLREGYDWVFDAYENTGIPRNTLAEIVLELERTEIERYLVDPSQSDRAFRLAQRRAERERRNRQIPGLSARASLASADRLEANENFIVLLEAAWDQRDAEPEATRLAAFAAAQDVLVDRTSTNLAAAVAESNADLFPPSIRSLIERRRTLLAALEPYQASDTTALSGFGYDVAGQLRQRSFFAALGDLETEFREVSAALQEQAPEFFAILQPGALDPSTASAMLAGDEAALMIVPTREEVHLFLVTQEGLRWEQAGVPASELDDLVRHVLWTSGVDIQPSDEEYDRWTADVEEFDVPFSRQAAYRLYQALFEPLGDDLAGKSHLFVSAAGSLSSLPFGLLVTEAPRGSDSDMASLRGTSWLADRIALVQMPSLQLLYYLRQFGPAPGAASAETFFGIGNPVLEGSPQVRGEDRVAGLALDAAYATTETAPQPADDRSLAAVLGVERGPQISPSRLGQMAALPGTEIELLALADAFGPEQSTLYLGAGATEARLKQADLAGYDVIGFATHALVAGEAGAAQPGIVLTPPATPSSEDDGLLSASEISRLRLTAQWVILSACNTAAGDGTLGAPALSGLARSFFYAGARNLLVSHWPVGDDVAPAITVRTVELMREDPALSRAQAFSRALADIRNDPDHDNWAHPQNWAPFVLVGDRR